jgi:hypothetical protein
MREIQKMGEAGHEQMKARQEETKAGMKIEQERMKALMGACLRAMKACLWKAETMIKTGQEQMTAEIKTDL